MYAAGNIKLWIKINKHIQIHFTFVRYYEFLIIYFKILLVINVTNLTCMSTYVHQFPFSPKCWIHSPHTKFPPAIFSFLLYFFLRSLNPSTPGSFTWSSQVHYALLIILWRYILLHPHDVAKFFLSITCWIGISLTSCQVISFLILLLLLTPHYSSKPHIYTLYM